MKNITLVCVLIVASFSHTSYADQRDWSFTPYIWAAGIQGDGQGGQVPLDYEFEFSDFINALDGAFMGRLAMSQGRHYWYGDLLYIGLDPNANDTIVTGRIDSELDAMILESAYSRPIGGEAFF